MLLVYNKGPRILKFNFEVNKVKQKDKVQITFNFKIHHQVDKENPKILHVYFGFEAGDESSPFITELSTETIFEIKPKKEKFPSKKDITKAVYLQAGPVIFPTINEYFNDLCRKAKIQIIDLPVANFSEFYSLYEDKIKEDSSCS